MKSDHDEALRRFLPHPRCSQLADEYRAEMEDREWVEGFIEKLTSQQWMFCLEGSTIPMLALHMLSISHESKNDSLRFYTESKNCIVRELEIDSGSLSGVYVDFENDLRVIGFHFENHEIYGQVVECYGFDEALKYYLIPTEVAEQIPDGPDHIGFPNLGPVEGLL